MAPRVSSGRGPSPSAEAARRGRDQARDEHEWDEEPRPRRRAPVEEATPWLEDPDDEDLGPSHTLVERKMLFGVIAVLSLLVIAVIAGIILLSKKEDTPIDVPAPGEEIPVLKFPGPWKVQPTGPGIDGVPVEGQGQILFGAGNGIETEAQIAFDSLPEDPLPHPKELLALEEEAAAQAAQAEAAALAAAQAAAPKQEPAKAAPKPVVPAEPKPAPKPVPEKPKTVATVTPKEAPKPVKAPPAPKPEPEQKPATSAPSGGGQALQLGAFSSEARARSAFKDLSARYRYLDGMEPQIIPVQTDGKTLYRLRTVAPTSSSASDLCGRLKVAGEACSVVR